MNHTTLRALRAGLALAMVLPSCSPGGSPFRGSFHGTSMGQRVVVELDPQGPQVTGQVTVGQLTCAFRGTAEGDQLTGTATGPQLASPVRIEARLDGGTLRWTAHLPDPLGGGTSAVTVDLQRVGAGPSGAEAATTAQGVDPRLVGNWRRTLDSNTRVSPGESLNMATDIYCTLAADGTSRYGGAQTAFSAENRLGSAAGETGKAAVTTGHWKTEGEVLYGRATGSTQWIPMGRFSVNAEALVLYPADGGKAQYWERQ